MSDTPPPTYRITILGCRVNHAEARGMEAILRDRGLIPAEDQSAADLEIVHTCSVTTSAARQSRQAIRRSRRSQSTHQSTIVTGCFVGTDPESSQTLAGSDDLVLAHDDGTPLLRRFARQLDRWLTNRQTISPIRESSGSCSPLSQNAARLLPQPTVKGRHIRAEVKIQDGCDASCTFCIIPKIRRRLRSKAVADTVDEVARLVDLGHREVVLTGIFIGAYGHETALRRRQADANAEHLADLLDAVAQVPGLARVRLSSMEPGDVTPALLDAMNANADVIVPHLHLPLQSGSDRILRRMNRQYRVSDYREMIAMVNESLTRDDLPPAITTDIICGFPGETADDFDATCALAEEVGYLHMHVFPYSPRPGTAAARWTKQFIPPAEIKQRVRTLIDLERDPRDGLSLRFRRRLMNRIVRLIIEQRDPNDPSFVAGRCDHYARIRFPGEFRRGEEVRVRIRSVTTRSTEGEQVRGPVRLPVLSRADTMMASTIPPHPTAQESRRSW